MVKYPYKPNNVFVPLPIMLLIYYVVSAQGKHPSTYNYIVTITGKNAEIQYKMVARLLRVIMLEFVLIFSYLEIAMVLSAFGKGMSLGTWFLPISLAAIFGTLGIYLYKSA